MRPQITNVLADRYASTAMLNIWSHEAKITTERKLWIAIMLAQVSLGMKIDPEAIADYERVLEDINLERILERERKSRHDVKARIEEFNYLAGHQLVHLGLTSRDLTENVEQMQILRALRLVRFKVIASLCKLADSAAKYSDLPMAGRSHNVAAQMTTLGKRFASAAEELEEAYFRLTHCITMYSLRGIKGPVGTQQDMMELLGDEKKAIELDRLIAEHLGFEHVRTSVGQVYPRSTDFDVLSSLVQIAATGSSFATTLRLMAGQELVTEGFKEGQVGSSAMPHKMNARTSERICGFYDVLRGHLTMIEGPAGNQWNEGDVSCSAVRRVALPDAFFAIDGLLEAWLTVLNEFGAYPAMIDREIERFLPFLTTTKLLMAAVKEGVGREVAHALIKKHAVAAALAMREGKENDMFHRLGEDSAWPFDYDATVKLVGEPISFTGRAGAQVAEVCSRIGQLFDANPEAASYQPEPIL